MEWMAWTWQTATFFGGIATLITIMTMLAIFKPETPRVGIFRFETTRGDRLFVTLLGSAFIFIAWIGLVSTILWWAAVICLAWAFFVFKWV